MQRQQELHQTKKFHLPVFLKCSIECRQSSFTCGIHDQRGLRFSLLNGVFMWICHQVTFQEIVSEPQTPFCPASYLYFAAKFILRNETSTAFISETGRFPIVKFGQIGCFNLKLEHIKKSKQSEKVTLASRNTLNTHCFSFIVFSSVPYSRCYLLFILPIQLSFISHRLAVHLYLQLTMDVGHAKHVL